MKVVYHWNVNNIWLSLHLVKKYSLKVQIFRYFSNSVMRIAMVNVRLYFTYSVSGPENRHIPLHLLQTWQGGFSAEIQIMLGQCWMQRSAALSCTIMWSSFLQKISCNCPMNVRYFRHLTLSKTGPTFWKIFNLNRCIFQGLDNPLKSPSPLPPQKSCPQPTPTRTQKTSLI